MSDGPEALSVSEGELVKSKLFVSLFVFESKDGSWAGPSAADESTKSCLFES